MVKADNKSKQIYKITYTEHFLSWLGFSKNKQINWSLKIDLKYKAKTEHEYRSLMKNKTKNQELVARPHLLPLVLYL